MSTTTQSCARGNDSLNVNRYDFVIEIIDAVQTILAETCASIHEGTLPEGSGGIVDHDDMLTNLTTLGSSARFLDQAGIYGDNVSLPWNLGLPNNGSSTYKHFRK